jgi:hypothetical protein
MQEDAPIEVDIEINQENVDAILLSVLGDFRLSLFGTADWSGLPPPAQARF